MPQLQPYRGIAQNPYGPTEEQLKKEKLPKEAPPLQGASLLERMSPSLRALRAEVQPEPGSALDRALSGLEALRGQAPAPAGAPPMSLSAPPTSSSARAPREILGLQKRGNPPFPAPTATAPALPPGYQVSLPPGFRARYDEKTSPGVPIFTNLDESGRVTPASGGPEGFFDSPRISEHPQAEALHQTGLEALKPPEPNQEYLRGVQGIMEFWKQHPKSAVALRAATTALGNLGNYDQQSAAALARIYGLNLLQQAEDRSRIVSMAALNAPKVGTVPYETGQATLAFDPQSRTYKMLAFGDTSAIDLMKQRNLAAGEQQKREDAINKERTKALVDIETSDLFRTPEQKAAQQEAVEEIFAQSYETDLSKRNKQRPIGALSSKEFQGQFEKLKEGGEVTLPNGRVIRKLNGKPVEITRR